MAISGSLSTYFAPRLPMLIPKVDDPALQTHVKLVTQEVNSLPNFSVFSYPTPESNVSALLGTIGINLNSASSRLWIKDTGSGNTGWQPVCYGPDCGGGPT